MTWASAVRVPDRRAGSTGPLCITVFTVASLLALVVLWKVLPVDEYLRTATDWIDDAGPFGFLAFGFIYVLAAVVGIPRTPMHIAAGVLFSFPVALLTVLSSAAAAYVLTFTIARTVARDWVSRQVAQSPRVKRLLGLVDEEGFRLVLMIRMNMLVPGVLKGYGFGTTNIAPGIYMAASLLGFLPIALAHVYLGWAGGEAILDNEAPSDLERWMMIGGVVLSLLLVAGIYYHGKKAMNRRFPGEAK